MLCLSFWGREAREERKWERKSTSLNAVSERWLIKVSKRGEKLHENPVVDPAVGLGRLKLQLYPMAAMCLQQVHPLL